MAYRSQMYALLHSLEAVIRQIEQRACFGMYATFYDVPEPQSELESALDRLETTMDMAVQAAMPECCLACCRTESRQATLHWLMTRLGRIEAALHDLETRAREHRCDALTYAQHLLLASKAQERRCVLQSAREVLGNWLYGRQITR